MDEHMSGSQQIRDVVTETEKLGSRCDAEALTQLSQTWLVRAIPYADEPRVGPAQVREGTNKKFCALVFGQIGDSHDPNVRRRAAHFRIGMEAFQADPIINGARLVTRELEMPN